MTDESLLCGSCGTKCWAASRYCTRCGAPLSASASTDHNPRPRDRELADIDDSFEALIGAPSTGAARAQAGKQQGTKGSTMQNESPAKEKRTIVEEGSEFEGTLRSNGPVDVRGRIAGQLDTPALTVSPTGAVHGRARVGSLRSEGELSGEFDADTIDLAGTVKKNTVIRARAIQLSLSSPDGKLELSFGDQPVQTTDALSTPALDAPPAAIVAAEPQAEPHDDHEGAHRNYRRRRLAGDRDPAPGGTRHSEPPPALG
jgi:cytoskeletal protein CcmA (bactofilin family)